MFCRPTPFAAGYDAHHPPRAYFSPLQSSPSLNSYLPSSYEQYDLERSQLEQALLARKQQERRQAEASAYLERQRQLERREAIERAIEAERERREFEQAVQYREALIRKAREEEELKRQYLEAIRIRELEARRREAALREAEYRRRRTIERARSGRAQVQTPRQSQQQAIDLPDLLRLIFGGGEHVASPDAAEKEEEEAKLIEPVQAQTSASSETPDLFQLVFGPRPIVPSSETPASLEPARATPSLVSKDTAARRSAPVALAEETPAIETPSSDDEVAATTVQRHFRRHLARRNALSKLSSLSSTFFDRQRSFEKPTSFTFQPLDSNSSTSPSTPPPLAFGSANAKFLSHEDFLVNLLSKIDAVESGGDRQVKQERKTLVRKVEKELSRLDAMKERAWEQQLERQAEVEQASTKDSHVEGDAEEIPDAQPHSTEEAWSTLTEPTLPILTPANDPNSSSLPVPVSTEPPAESEVENLEPLLRAATPLTDSPLPPSPRLTKAALSSLEAPTSSGSTEPTTTTTTPRSESGSSTTSSTLTISTEGEDSPISELIEQVLKRAEKLGRGGNEVEKLESEEKQKPVEKKEEKEEETEFVVV